MRPWSELVTAQLGCTYYIHPERCNCEVNKTDSVFSDELNLYYGDRGSEFGGFKLPGTDLRNRPPNNAYLWFIYYF
jgi:hypothetical protein